jgi:hypothetical protein
MTGFIGVGQLRYSMFLFPGFATMGSKENRILTSMFIVLTNLGEKMSDEEVDELLKAVDTSSGEINYTGKSVGIYNLIVPFANDDPSRSCPHHPRQLIPRYD